MTLARGLHTDTIGIHHAYNSPARHLHTLGLAPALHAQSWHASCYAHGRDTLSLSHTHTHKILIWHQKIGLPYPISWIRPAARTWAPDATTGGLQNAVCSRFEAPPLNERRANHSDTLGGAKTTRKLASNEQNGHRMQTRHFRFFIVAIRYSPPNSHVCSSLAPR